MLLPISTDAPVYYWPFATVGLIVVNFICFLFTGLGSEEAAHIWGPWALEHGNGLHPLQWITSNFIHGGFMHLFGNMIFLWGFGLVVEGKLGWWKFLLVYFGIGISQCAFEQIVTLGFKPETTVEQKFGDALEELRAELKDEGLSDEEVEAQVTQFKEELTSAVALHGSKSFGASSIVYGLMAMSLVWAPKNEVTLLIMLGFRVFTWEVTIMSFSAWYIGLEILTAVFERFAIATATLHVMGAVAGFGLGTLMLKKNMVDCEDWDLFAVMSGHYGPHARDKFGNRIERPVDNRKAIVAEEPAPKKKPKQHGPSASTVQKKLEEIEEFIAQEDFVTANDELYNLRLKDKKAILDPIPLKDLIAGLFKGKHWDEVLPLMDEFIETYPDQAAPIRMRLANYHLTVTEDPRSALKALKPITQETLSDEARATFQKLVKTAKSALKVDEA